MTDYDAWLWKQVADAWDDDYEEPDEPPFPSSEPGWWWGDANHDRAGRDADEALDFYREEIWIEDDRDIMEQ